MGERYTVYDMEWSVGYEEALERLHVSEDDEDDFKAVYDAVLPLLKPVVYIGKEEIISNDGHNINIGGQTFHSRVVSVNLAEAKYVYPYVMTSGRAAYEYALTLDDDLFRYWADSICEIALKSAGKDFLRRFKEKLGTENVYAVNPGSVIDWPINQQQPLFDLLGNVWEQTGIMLEKSFLMRPVKSGSGIYYVSDKHYANCMLCPRNGCPNRRSPFDPEMFKREYGE